MSATIELKWTCDAQGNWQQVKVWRVPDGKGGWREHVLGAVPEKREVKA